MTETRVQLSVTRRAQMRRNQIAQKRAQSYSGAVKGEGPREHMGIMVREC